MFLKFIHLTYKKYAQINRTGGIHIYYSNVHTFTLTSHSMQFSQSIPSFHNDKGSYKII